MTTEYADERKREWDSFPREVKMLQGSGGRSSGCSADRSAPDVTFPDSSLYTEEPAAELKSPHSMSGRFRCKDEG